MSIDYESQLWATCAHEAAHYVVGQAVDGEPSWPVIVDDERGRVEMEGLDPTSAFNGGEEGDAAHHYATFLLAGPAVDEVFYGYASHRSQGDIDNATALLDEHGLDFDAAMRDARDQVSEGMDEIGDLADQLYREHVGAVHV